MRRMRGIGLRGRGFRRRRSWRRRTEGRRSRPRSLGDLSKDWESLCLRLHPPKQLVLFRVEVSHRLRRNTDRLLDPPRRRRSLTSTRNSPLLLPPPTPCLVPKQPPPTSSPLPSDLDPPSQNDPNLEVETDPAPSPLETSSLPNQL